MIGRKFILTGGTGGLGQALVAELAARGAHILIAGRNKERLDAIQSSFPDQIEIYQLDMGSRKAVEQFCQHLLTENATYDGLINNAGYGYFKAFQQHDEREIIDIMNVNVVHPAILTKGVLNILRPGSSIVNIVSQSARVATPYGSLYAASKAALLSLSNSLRLEYPEYHVMTVSTGPVATEFFARADAGGRYSQSTQKIQLDKNELAADIIEAMLKKQDEVNSPGWMQHGLTVYNTAPRTFEKLFKSFFLSKKEH